MVQYTLAQSPEVMLTVPGKDSIKAREKAMDQLMAMLDDGKLSTSLADGFSPSQLVEVREPLPSDSVKQQDDQVVQAIQMLNHLATLKVKLQDARGEAMQVWQLVDLLFTDEPMSEDELAQLKDGLKTLKSFAQSNLRYRDVKQEAETARQILDQALQ